MHQTAQVAHLKGEGAVRPGVVPDDAGAVIDADDPVEADVLPGAHGGDHVDVALVREHLLERRHLTPGVAEVSEEHLALAADAANRRHHVGARHGADGAHAETDAVVRRWHQVDNALQTVDIHQDAGDAQVVRHRSIVGMDRELDPRRLGDGHDVPQKPLQIVPDLLRRQRPIWHVGVAVGEYSVRNPPSSIHWYCSTGMPARPMFSMVRHTPSSCRSRSPVPNMMSS